MSNHPRTDLKAQRVKEAEERASQWTKLTNDQKLASLDARLGVNVGAAQQRAKLLEQEG